MEVLRDGSLTFVLEKGSFCCDGGLHSGLLLGGSIEACGTIVVGPPFDPAGHNNAHRRVRNHVRCLTWDRNELVSLLRREHDLFVAFKAALSWDIVRTLKSQRGLITTGRVRDAAAWTRKREAQGAARYASILQNMLRRRQLESKLGVVDEAAAAEEAAVLANYRVIHQIDDREHARVLAECGWTEEDFRLGREPLLEDEEFEEEELVGNRWSGLVRKTTQKMVESLLK